jgi:hypothetical protein
MLKLELKLELKRGRAGKAVQALELQSVTTSRDWAMA